MPASTNGPNVDTAMLTNSRVPLYIKQDVCSIDPAFANDRLYDDRELAALMSIGS